jgi:hypothetical protein
MANRFKIITSNGGLIKPLVDTLTGLQVQDTDGNTVFDVDTINNRVGIGTTSPAYPLSVVGNSSGSLNMMDVSNLNTTGQANMLFISGSKYSLFSQASQSRGGTTNGITTAGLSMFQSAGDNLMFDAAGNSENIIFTTNDGSADVERLRIDHHGGLWLQGSNNVVQLIVKGNATQTANLQEWQNSSGTVLASMDAGGGAVFNETGLSTADFRVESDTEANMIFLDASADTIEFGGTGATAAKVAKGGNITSPLGDIGFPYGSFSDSTTQTWASVTTAYPITFNTDEYKFNVTHSTSTNPSRVYVDVAGVYMVTFSACTSSPSGSGHVNIWARKNGTDIARTNTTVELLELVQTVMTVTYIFSLAANDYIELVGNSQDVANCTLNATGVQTTPDVPASPSIILTINKISK